MKKTVLSKTIFIFTLMLVSIIFLAGCSDKASDNALINNPPIENVRDAISSIAHIDTIEIVTEDNDPNGQLGKQGGYTGALFFIYGLVEDNDDESPLSAGTDGGGSIEVYANAEDAEKRNDYLAVFDGGVFSSGSHVVLGSLVIRTSNELSASQQSTLESAIINALNN